MFHSIGNFLYNSVAWTVGKPLDNPNASPSTAPQSQPTPPSTAIQVASTNPFSAILNLITSLFSGVVGILSTTQGASSVASSTRSRDWSKYNPTLDFPQVEVIDETIWRRIFYDEILTEHGLSFDDADPLDGQALHTYLRGFDFSKIKGTDSQATQFLGAVGLCKKGEQTGMAFITIPKGLTFNKLVALSRKPKVGGHAAKFRHIWERISEDLGNIEVQKTYRVAITKNVIQGSEPFSESFDDLDEMYQKQHEITKAMSGEMPGVLEATLLPILKFMSAPSGSRTPTRLFNSAPWTTTTCREKIDTFPYYNVDPWTSEQSHKVERYPLTVGGFDEAGLAVANTKGLPSSGVVVSRKF